MEDRPGIEEEVRAKAGQQTWWDTLGHTHTSSLDRADRLRFPLVMDRG